MINTIQMINSWFSAVLRGFAGYTNAADHEYFFDASVDFEDTFGAGADLRGYLLELGDGSRYRLYQVISPTQVELFDPCLALGLAGQRWWIRRMDDPPDHLWAELTYLDNRSVIEGNFGRLIGFTLDHLAERTDDLDYLSAVQGLWYYVWNSRTVYRTRVASQIILGLPFAEVRGHIVEIESPFDSARDRILVQDIENPSSIRSYLFPSALSLEDNPTTGAPYSVGETIERFAPICKGVVVTDYIEDPDWFRAYTGSGDLYELQKTHTFGVLVDSEIFDLTNLTFLIGYLKQYKPTYVDSLFVVTQSPQQTIDIDDALLMGPVVPPASYTYPTGWPAYNVPIGWADSPYEVARAASPTVPPTLGIDFGGLHLADVPGKSPDGWRGFWPSGAAGLHAATISEGSFRYDDTDESGHCIHRYDEHLFANNLLSDGDMEHVDHPGVGFSPWDRVGAPTTAFKVGAPVLSGTRSLHIADTGTHVGVEQPLDGLGNHPGPYAHPAGFQVGVVVWVYLVSGQACIRLRDQDVASTILAEWRHTTNHLQWTRIRLHTWETSVQNTNYLTLQILTGPAGGEFYVDAAGSADWQQVGMFPKAMPWTQWGFDRAIRGRTGGYTFGGLPDEDLSFQIVIPAP